jgi:predicted permease
MSMSGPPRLARWLLRLQLLGDRRAEIEADLHELYAARAAARGLRHARRRYYQDVLSLWRAPAAPTCQPSWSASGRPRFAAGILQDLAYAARLVRRTPGVVLIAIAGLGVAIGVSTSIFSIVNGLAFKPSGIDDSRSVTRLLRREAGGYFSTWRYSEAAALRAASSDMPIEGWLPQRQSLFAAGDGGEGPVASAMFVTGGYLRTLSERVTAGRLLTVADDQRDAPPVAVVSHGFWVRQLGQDPGAVGRTVRWNGVGVTIVGVAARGFRGTSESAPDLWAPIAAFPPLVGGAGMGADGALPIALLTRMPRGVSTSQAEARLAATVASLPVPPPSDHGARPALGVRLESAESSMPRSKRASIITALVIVMVAMGLLLTLACVNVASLLLANGVARRAELGVRIALGASRGRLVRQLLTESLSLGLLGGAAGLVITLWLLPLLTRVAGAPATLDVTPDLRVLGFLVAVSIAAGIGAGLAPARHAADDDVSGVLKAGSRGGGSGRLNRVRSIFVGVQAAASIVLVVLAALLTRGMVAATRIDIGFAADQVLTAVPTFPPAQNGSVATDAYFDSAVERLGAVPGIAGAALATFPPYGGGARVTIFNRADGRYTIQHNDTSADYFRTLGLRVLRGRTYTTSEVRDRARVAVVSEAVANDFFPGEDPIGQPLSRVVEDDRTTVIVGVVSNAITMRLRERSEAAIYHPIADRRAARLLIRTASPSSQVATVRTALQSLDNRIRVDVVPVAEGLDRQLAESRVLASLAVTLAGVALCLAVVGLHGVTTFVVNQRRQEIMLRVALGATDRDVLRLLLGDSLRPVTIGLGAGVLIALGGSRVIAGALYGIGPADPLAFAASVAILLLSVLPAILVPAHRATTVDPAEVLKGA